MYNQETPFDTPQNSEPTQFDLEDHAPPYTPTECAWDGDWLYVAPDSLLTRQLSIEGDNVRDKLGENLPALTAGWHYRPDLAK